VGKLKSKIIGRKSELELLKACIQMKRNCLVEGPVGVGKTFLIKEVLSEKGLLFQRVDGDTRYTEAKLTGWFDPPLVLKKGYIKDAFIEGPLITAMKKGQVLFINELNRMPEAVQNILLPAMDEKHIFVPKLGRIEAKPGFFVVATQNPKEFTATHSLSEALLDRFEMLTLDYQSKEEELAILALDSKSSVFKLNAERVLDLVRATRKHPSIKRGASIRAALAILELIEGGLSFEQAVLLALPSRIEMISADEDPLKVIGELEKNSANSDLFEKKKV
jgi:MoxR-like ATPase